MWEEVKWEGFFMRFCVRNIGEYLFCASLSWPLWLNCPFEGWLLSVLTPGCQYWLLADSPDTWMTVLTPGCQSWHLADSPDTWVSVLTPGWQSWQLADSPAQLSNKALSKYLAAQDTHISPTSTNHSRSLSSYGNLLSLKSQSTIEEYKTFSVPSIE